MKFHDKKIILSTIIILSIFYALTLHEYSECKEKGGVLTQGMFWYECINK